MFALSQPTVSHHLALLSESGVLVVRQQAQHHFISVDRRFLGDLAACLPNRLTAKTRPRSGPPASRRS